MSLPQTSSRFHANAFTIGDRKFEGHEIVTFPNEWNYSDSQSRMWRCGACLWTLTGVTSYRRFRKMFDSRACACK